MNIDPVELGRRIRSARERAELTQAQAAKAIGVSRPTLIAVERGRRAPKRTEIERMLDLYNVSAGELYRQTTHTVDIQPHLRAVAGSGNTGSELEHAIALFTRHIENLRYLEQIMGISVAPSLPEERPIPAHSNVTRFAESVAISERARLGMGDQPIIELRRLLDQEAGVRIFYGPLTGKLAGLFAYVPEGGYYILVNRKHPPPRRRWTIAHEYGHFLSERYSPGVDYAGKPIRKPRGERFADAFAAGFLMPRSGVERSFYQVVQVSGDFQVADLCKLANRYFVSLQAMTLRLEQLSLIARGTWQLLMEGNFRPEKARAELGFGQEEARITDSPWPESYQFLAVRAFTEGKLSIGQLAGLLDTDVVGARMYIEARSQMSDDIDSSYSWGVELQQSLLDEQKLAAG
jgi:Zn-dependent peptidase ImmA (M78 family)/DNA-binding XRE family transcriptional regulator